MIEKEYEVEKDAQFSGKSVFEQRDSLNHQISHVSQEIESYLNRPIKCVFYIAIPIFLFNSYIGLHWSWTTYLPVGADSANHWTAADDHFRRCGLSIGAVVLAAFISGVQASVISLLGSSLLKLTNPYKKLKHQLSSLKEKLFSNEKASKAAMREDKNRFNLLWELESIIQQSETQYSSEFMAERNLRFYQKVLENAYVSDDEATIEQTMKEIYQLPANLELQWQEFNAEKIRLEKHAKMKDAYWQYLKEEGKEIFPAQDFDSIARQTL
jgi:hypothetical protein